MMVLAMLADLSSLTPPDFEPMHQAVEKCDRDAMGKLTKAEPHRRAEFAGAVYAEQQAVAAERAKIDTTAPTTPAGKISLETERVSLDARQKRLDDAKLVEKAWREAVDEMRADYLANCDLHGGKR